MISHELRAWLRNPSTSLDDWDHHVQYPEIPCLSKKYNRLPMIISHGVRVNERKGELGLHQIFQEVISISGLMIAM